AAFRVHGQGGETGPSCESASQLAIDYPDGHSGNGVGDLTVTTELGLQAPFGLAAVRDDSGDRHEAGGRVVGVPDDANPRFEPLRPAALGASPEREVDRFAAASETVYRGIQL